MTGPRRPGSGTRAARCGLAALIMAVLLAAGAGPAAAAAEEALSDADRQCLGCHAAEGMQKALADGSALSLQVRGEAFARSVHKAIGCAGCHGDIDLKSHPAVTREIKSARQHSIDKTQVCRQCHEDAFKQQEGSIHAARVREGNPIAPVCSGCHGAHTVTPRTAYETCVGCHAAALGEHQKWLPNAALHHEVVSCAACHAPSVLRMIDLRLYDRVAKTWVSEKEGEARFEKLARSADAAGDGLDPAELRALLAELNRGDPAAALTLRGRVELRTGAEAHQLSEKARAIRTCDSCHRSGAEPFQNVAVSVTGPDGRPVRYRARTEVLTAVHAVESLPEFYAIGGTRNRLLDALLVLVLLGGVGVPLGHMAIRWIARKRRNP